MSSEKTTKQQAIQTIIDNLPEAKEVKVYPEGEVETILSGWVEESHRIKYN